MHTAPKDLYLLRGFMPLLLLVLCLAFSAVSASAQTAQQPAAKSQSLSANKEIARRFYLPFATGNTATFQEVLAPNWDDIPMASGQKPGRDGLGPIVQLLRGMFSNFSIVSQDFVAEGDKVAVRTVWSGVHTGDVFGVKNTGKKITLNTTDIHQIANGTIIRTWHLEDMMGVYAQVGGLNPKP
jgi:predicted ester cyclase